MAREPSAAAGPASRDAPYRPRAIRQRRFLTVAASYERDSAAADLGDLQNIIAAVSRTPRAAAAPFHVLILLRRVRSRLAVVVVVARNITIYSASRHERFLYGRATFLSDARRAHNRSPCVDPSDRFSLQPSARHGLDVAAYCRGYRRGYRRNVCSFRFAFRRRRS